MIWQSHNLARPIYTSQSNINWEEILFWHSHNQKAYTDNKAWISACGCSLSLCRNKQTTSTQNDQSEQDQAYNDQSEQDDQSEQEKEHNRWSQWTTWHEWGWKRTGNDKEYICCDYEMEMNHENRSQSFLHDPSTILCIFLHDPRITHDPREKSQDKHDTKWPEWTEKKEHNRWSQ